VNDLLAKKTAHEAAVIAHVAVAQRLQAELNAANAPVVTTKQALAQSLVKIQQLIGN
jgi:hypothetical protein